MKSAILGECQSTPSTMTILEDFEIDYSSIGIVLQDFISSLPIYTFTELGLSDTTLDDEFSINVANSFFIIDDEEVSPTYILGISINGNFLTAATILKNFSV